MCIMLHRILVPLLLLLLQLRMVPLPQPPLRTQQHASVAAAATAGIWNIAFAQRTCAFSHTHRQTCTPLDTYTVMCILHTVKHAHHQLCNWYHEASRTYACNFTHRQTHSSTPPDMQSLHGLLMVPLPPLLM
jgi:hypothetical protein